MQGGDENRLCTFFANSYKVTCRSFLLLEISLHHVNDFVEIFELFFSQIIRNSFSELLQHKYCATQESVIHLNCCIHTHLSERQKKNTPNIFSDFLNADK